MRLLLSALVLFSAATSADAAEFRSFTAKDGRVLISVVGELSEGDTDRFKSAIKAANDANKFVANIRLNSPGGSLVEGVKLAEAVQFAKIATNVGKDGTCASACFLVFAAGATKFANYNAKVGVHGASKGGEEAGDGTVAMARVAKELGVPAAIIGRMVVTPPSEMVWLSPQDLQSMGTTMVGKPEQIARNDVQARLPQQTRPGDPTDLQPPAKTSKVPTWNEIVDLAMARSARQNGGKAQTVRTCQPELKTCVNGVRYTNSDNVVTFLKVTKDMNDRIIRKEVCEFNSTMDIRKCFDWDTNKSRRDMQDSAGNWTKIADE